jgi:uncharacterized membrane-anchored protein
MTGYSEPLTRLERLPGLIGECFRRGDKEAAYQYLEEVKERVSELQAQIRLMGNPWFDAEGRN